MSTAQKAALVFGIAFLAAALLGFLTTPPTLEASLEHAPRLLGIFPVNLLHNAVHLLFGLWGVLGARRPGSARGFLRGAGIIYLVLVVVGLISPTTFGLIPIGGEDILLHLLLAVPMLLIGYRAGSPASAPV